MPIFARLRPDRFRAAHPAIGLRIMEPAGLPELVEGKVDVLITRHLSDHPGYRGERLGNDFPGAGDFLISPTALQIARRSKACAHGSETSMPRRPSCLSPEPPCAACAEFYC